MAIKLNTFFIFLFITFLAIVHPSLGHLQGFTTNLIHRDYSPLSPLYNSSLNQYERLRNSIQRSISKIERFSISSSNGVQSRVTTSKGDYHMELSYGTPPVSQFSILDTGSDLIWTQCEPCMECYKQDNPIFDPRKSSTYKVQSCNSKVCQALGTDEITCTGKGNCTYTYNYGDDSHTAGDLATETITFKSEGTTNGTSFPMVTFGCGHRNGGVYTSDGSGVVGLGGGPLSLVSQLGSSIGGKFSYCLIPFAKEGNYTSTINFGTNGEVSGPGVISTPIVPGDPKTFYYLTLNGISVGNTKIPFYKKSFTNDDFGNTTSNKGNIFIDSGTTFTFLPSDMFDQLSNTLEKVIQGTKVRDPTGGELQNCYKTTKGGADLNIPNVTAHFDGGDLVWKPSNTFFEVAKNIVCLAMVPSGQGILGNVAQMDFLVGYDTVKGIVSFKPTDCTKEHR